MAKEVTVVRGAVTATGSAMAAIGGFEPHPLLAVAVSGGHDSMALAILADQWARERGGTVWARRGTPRML